MIGKRDTFRRVIRKGWGRKLLLVLAFHALFVSATHHHSLNRVPGTGGVVPSIGAAQKLPPGSLDDTDQGCSLCNLSRTFASSLTNATLVYQPVAQSAVPTALAPIWYSASRVISISGRSPPSFT